MNSRHLLAGAGALLGALLVWYIVSVESEVSALRAEVAKGPGTMAAPMEARTESGARERASETPVSSSGYERTLEELDQAKDRIAELERTVEELSNAWNQFAADEEAKRKKASMRGWGPEQATGAPDTKGAGDQATAWAPAIAEGGVEWLQTQYEKAVEVAQVRVLQNDGAGAVVKVTAMSPTGETVLWTGSAAAVAAPYDQVIAVPPGTVAQCIRVYLDTGKVPGWNEVDAVELIGRDGSRQWAAGASASSTYARSPGGNVTYLDAHNGGARQLLLRDR